MQVSSEQDPVETEVKGNININYVYRKFPMCNYRVIGMQDAWQNQRRVFFLFNKELIP